jgi:hypothetical protein
MSSAELSRKREPRVSHRATHHGVLSPRTVAHQPFPPPPPSSRIAAPIAKSAPIALSQIPSSRRSTPHRRIMPRSEKHPASRKHAGEISSSMEVGRSPAPSRCLPSQVERRHPARALASSNRRRGPRVCARRGPRSCRWSYCYLRAPRWSSCAREVRRARDARRAGEAHRGWRSCDGRVHHGWRSSPEKCAAVVDFDAGGVCVLDRGPDCFLLI